ncbi:MAG: Ig-like domain-containing protein, partial [Deltaproteobacteria bacterium]|nr:Ig-like domain-containing protein [Deltaproteobacteria bacterium]
MKRYFPLFLIIIFTAINCSGPTSSDTSGSVNTDVIITIDTSGTRDENRPDTSGEDLRDTGFSDAEEISDTGVDTIAPYVVSAFSPDGKVITVRFSEPIDGKTGSKAENYTIKGSDNSTIAVSSVTVKDEFATLSIPSTAVINPQLTYTVLVQNVT